MTDILPGTLMEVYEKYPDSRRLDHPTFGDVSKTTFAKGVITAFYAVNEDDPPVAADKCDVEVDGEEFKEVPIFYHQQKDYVENWKQNAEQAEFWEKAGVFDNETGTMGGAAYSFSVNDEVVVMLKEGVAVAVLGFADGIPRRPFDFVEVELPTQLMSTDDDPPNEPETHSPYVIQLSDINRDGGWTDGLGIPGRKKGPDGFDLKLLKDAKIFPDKTASPAPGEPLPFELSWTFTCYYGNEAGGDIVLNPLYWNPVPDFAFGPFIGGFMHYGESVPTTPWADYLAAWMNTCDIIQTRQWPDGPNQLWIGAWPFGRGRPTYWQWIVNDLDSHSLSKYVMRTFLIEAGPILYLIRTFYQHNTGGGKVWYWRNRIAWPWTDSLPPPGDWSGYDSDPSTWTAPIWPSGPNPYPNSIEECIPSPDGFLTNSIESFYSDNPHYIYAAPSSKEILGNIESIVAASNGKIDVIKAQGQIEIPDPPEGFIQTEWPVYNGGIIPPFGNIRELNFKIAARIGEEI